jgi:hypothetical protein
MSLPLIMQANTWVGFFFCYIAIAAIYYSNTWNASTISLPLYSNNLLFVVEIFPYALNIALRFQRFYLRPNGRFYEAPFPIEPDGASRGRHPCADWIKRMVGVGGLHCHWRSPRPLHLFLGPIRRVISEALSGQDPT